MKIEDKILQQIDQEHVVAFTKKDTEDRMKALDRLFAFGLVYEQPKHQWRLKEKGYKAVALGFDKWVKDNENSKLVFSTNNVSIIKGNNNQVNQSHSDYSHERTIKQINKATNEIKPANTLWIKKLSWVTSIIIFIKAIYELWLALVE
ncbi:hypothetical protein [Algoriphagus persicinus]|uniref:hypothetical protein n=1 Tax=Algoriphagus persicinus TaxID=3108754 RepID=UPI002B3E07FF|nr:hypothetical protein [Algoriphagus sp. E1-3-M2]MEB2786891.1 hypothetical protein [Algoriphagus sp. E1-3-M2]